MEKNENYYVRPDALGSELEIKVVKEVKVVRVEEKEDICPSQITQYYG